MFFTVAQYALCITAVVLFYIYYTAVSKTRTPSIEHVYKQYKCCLNMIDRLVVVHCTSSSFRST